MKRTKKVTYKVQCAFNSEYIFEKFFEIEMGLENVKSEVQTYCPFCDRMVTVTVQGKIPPDIIIRKFNLQSDR